MVLIPVNLGGSLITRALYKRPAYLFRHKVASTIDRQNEASLLANTANVFPATTKINIAHCLKTARGAD